jgi:HlyD family secretion protein
MNKGFKIEKMTNMNKGIFLSAVFLLVACGGKQDFDATGTFEATEVTLSAETTGRLLTLASEEGMLVHEGEVLAVVDTAALHLQLQQLRTQQSALLKSRPDIGKQVASLRSQIVKQEREVARVENLVKDNAATRKQLDDAQTQLGVLRNQLDATLSQLGSSSEAIEQNAAAMEWQIKQVALQLERSTLKAPMDGMVLATWLHPGEMAVAGRPLLKVADLDHIYLRAYFTSDQLSKVNLGQKVTVTADFGGDERYDYEGTVTWIASESEFTPKNIQTRSSRANLVYAAKIAVVNDGRLKVGVYGEVKL